MRSPPSPGLRFAPPGLRAPHLSPCSNLRKRAAPRRQACLSTLHRCDETAAAIEVKLAAADPEFVVGTIVEAKFVEVRHQIALQVVVCGHRVTSLFQAVEPVKAWLNIDRQEIADGFTDLDVEIARILHRPAFVNFAAPHRRERQKTLVQPAVTRKPSNPCKLRHMRSRELDQPLALQGVSLQRIEVGIPPVLAPQPAAMPRKEIAQLRNEAGAVRKVDE